MASSTLPGVSDSPDLGDLELTDSLGQEDLL